MGSKNSFPQPPIFILGAPRSGTTLLRVMLNSHSALVIPHEFPLVERVIDRFKTDRIPREDIEIFVNTQFQDQHFLDWKLSERDLMNQFGEALHSRADVVNAFYKSYMAKWSPDSTIWGDKNIGSIALIPEIFELFPEAKFVHIVRDGRDVAASLSKRGWLFYQFRNGRRHYIKNPIGGICTWLEALDYLQKDKNRLNDTQLLEIRYADLLDDPEHHLKQICSFLNIAYESEMLNYYQLEKNTASISPKRLKNTHENILKPVNKENKGSYTSTFSADQIAVMEYLAISRLNQYKYVIGTPIITLNNDQFRWVLFKYKLKLMIVSIGYLIKSNIKRLIR